MRFRILGPLRVHTGAGWVPVAAEQQRVVLAVLLADAGRAVSTDLLVDALWGDNPPGRATNTLHVYVMRLRRLFGDGVLATRSRGYELVVDHGDVDAAVFERMVAAGRRELDEGRPDAGATRLAKALALWRGPVFADVPASPLLAGRAASLEHLRLAADEDRYAALLDLVQHRTVVDELHRLVDESPLRERRWALLMTALDRCGRRGEALEAYLRAHRVLRAELGVDPGPQLRELQRGILAEDRTQATASGPRVVPAQLPADVAGFTGRDDELKQLDAVLAAGDNQAATAVVISAIAGTAGVGKTALAVHWGHRVRDRFGDGQLYVNLRGYANRPPVTLVEVLTRFLHALGVPGERVPSDVDEAGVLYRSLLAGRRMLVLLDNARHADQVRPLLPGTPGCLTVVTSRDQLAGLVARDGATPLALDVLTADEAYTLLVRVLGADRVGNEPAAAAELARLCGHLPLALRIAAANLSARPHTSIAAHAARLRRDLLDGLAMDGDPQAGVRAAFDLSYTVLPARARRLFRLLGLVPGPDVTTPAAAALAGADPTSVAQLLDRLAAAHLVDEYTPGRYSLHDLIRSYAAERAGAEAEPDRRDALDRLYDHYQRHLHAAADVLYPELLRLPRTDPHADPHPIRFDSEDAASAWIEAERSNLVATAVHTAEHGPRQVAWQLADVLRGYFVSRMSIVDWRAVAEAGLAAAEAEADERALAASTFGLGLLHYVTRNSELAVDHYTRAASHARRADWPEGEAAAWGDIGGVYLTLGQYEAAADYYVRTLAARRRLGWLGGEAITLSNLGLVYWGLGRLELAAEHHTQAVDIYRRMGNATAEARVNGALGVVLHAMGRFHDAASVLTSALAVLRAAGERYWVGYALYCLTEVHRDLGNDAEARDTAEETVAVAGEVGDGSLQSSALVGLGGVQLSLGDHQEAVHSLTRALTLARDVAEPFMETEVLVRLASAHRCAGQLDIAGDVARQALALARQGGYRLFEGQALTVLAVTQLAQGEHGAALDTARQALSAHRETGHRLGQAQAHLVAGEALRRDGHDADAAADAAVDHEAADALFTELGVDASRHATLLGV